MNREIRQLEDNLITVLNSSGIPIEAKRYVLLNVLNLVEKEANKAIYAEMNQSITEEGELKDAESA